MLSVSRLRNFINIRLDLFSTGLVQIYNITLSTHLFVASYVYSNPTDKIYLHFTECWRQYVRVLRSRILFQSLCNVSNQSIYVQGKRSYLEVLHADNIAIEFTQKACVQLFIIDDLDYVMNSYVMKISFFQLRWNRSY